MTSRRKFTKEFKEAAVSRVNAGESLSQVARSLEVHPAHVHRWKRELQEHGARAFQGSGHQRAEKDKVAELDPLSDLRPSYVYLPNTLPGNRKYYTHIRLLTRVDPYASGALGFEGKLFWCGARVSSDQLGERPIALEYAGPDGKQKPREHLWILWRYDWQTRTWINIARAIAYDGSWAIVLRPLAVRELAPLQPNVIPAVRGGDLAEELLAEADTRLAQEPLEVQQAALNAMHNGVAGLLARIERQLSDQIDRQRYVAAFEPGRARTVDGKAPSRKKTETG